MKAKRKSTRSTRKSPRSKPGLMHKIRGYRGLTIHVETLGRTAKDRCNLFVTDKKGNVVEWMGTHPCQPTDSLFWRAQRTIDAMKGD